MKRIDQGEVQRNGRNQPVINGIAYSRPSAVAKLLDGDPQPLINWSCRLVASAFGSSPDLVAASATTDPSDKRAMDSIVKQAMERARSKSAATMGTAIHAATEMLDLGEPLTTLPDAVASDAKAYRAIVDNLGLEPLVGEMFVVCEELRCAGSFDRLYRGSVRNPIGDLKTSTNPDTVKWAGFNWAIQCAIYAHSKPFLNGEVVEWSELGLPEPDQERALVVHVPQGSGTAFGYSVDLTVGWRAAQIAIEAKSLKSSKGLVTAV